LSIQQILKISCIFLFLTTLTVFGQFELIDEADPDSELLTPNEPNKISPDQEIDTNPFVETEKYKFWLGNWRTYYAAIAVGILIIIYVMFWALYNMNVNKWVFERERSPESLRSLNLFWAAFITFLVWGIIFVLLLSVFEITGGLILFGALSLIMLIIILVKSR